MAEGNGWDNYKLLILEKLESIEETQEGHTEKLAKVQSDVAAIQADAKVARYVGGIVIPGAVSIGLSWLGRKLGF